MGLICAIVLLVTGNVFALRQEIVTGEVTLFLLKFTKRLFEKN